MLADLAHPSAGAAGSAELVDLVEPSATLALTTPQRQSGAFAASGAGWSFWSSLGTIEWKLIVLGHSSRTRPFTSLRIGGSPPLPL